MHLPFWVPVGHSWTKWTGGASRARGLLTVRAEGSSLHFSFTGVTLYSHPYGGALLNEDKM